jgi:predicted nucleotide-binding protein
MEKKAFPAAHNNVIVELFSLLFIGPGEVYILIKKETKKMMNLMLH